MSANNIPLNFTMQVQGDAEVQAKLNKTGDSADQLGQKTEKASQSAGHAYKNYGLAAAGIAGTASSIAGLSQNFGDLEKGELRVQQAEKSVTSARASLMSAQEQLNKLVSAGITSGPQYEQATLKVKAAHEQLDIAQKQVDQSQGDLSDAQTNFALSVIPTVVSAATGLSGVIGTLKDSQIASRIATELGIRVSNADAEAKKLQSFATGAANTATKELSTSSKLLNLAMGPVGIAIFGVSTFMALFATNAFGIRDAINAAGKAIGDAIPILRPLLDVLAGAANSLFPQASDKAQDFGSLASDSLDKVTEKMPDFSQASQTSAEQVMSNFDDMATKAKDMQQLTAASMGLMTDNVGTSVTQQTASFTDLGKAAIESGNVVAQSFNNAANAAAKAAANIAAAAARAASAMANLGMAGATAAAAAGGSGGIITAANGYVGNVDQATVFVAGEAGPEHVNIAPIGSGRTGSSGGNGSVNVTSVINLDGKEIARVVSKHQATSL